MSATWVAALRSGKDVRLSPYEARVLHDCLGCGQQEMGQIRTSSPSPFLAFLFASLIKRYSAHDAVNLKVTHAAQSTMHQANAVYQPIWPDKWERRDKVRSMGER